MQTLNQLREQRGDAWTRLNAIVDTAKAEKRDLTDAERGDYDRIEAEFRAAGEALMHAEKRHALEAEMAGREFDAEQAAEVAASAGSDLGSHFVNSVRDQLSNVSRGSRFTVGAEEFKAAATDTISTDGAQVPTFDTKVVEQPRRATVVDLLDTGSIDSNALTYFVERGWEGAFAGVAEGAQKPQLSTGFDPVTESVKKIAGWVRESDEVVEDFAFIASTINGRLIYKLALAEEAQVLGGDGTGANLLGLLNRSGIQTESATAAADNADALYRAASKVSTGAGLVADGIIINPADYQKLRLAKDGNGQYLGGGFFAGAYGNGGVSFEPPLWGIPTVVSPAVTAGTALVGAFKSAATLYAKGGVRVEATNSNEDDFTNNRITIRAEKRRLLAVRVPAGLVKVTLA